MTGENVTVLNETVSQAVSTVQDSIPSSFISFTASILSPIKSLFNTLWPYWGPIIFPLAIAVGLGYYLSKKAFTPNSIWITFSILLYVTLKALGL